MKVYMFYINKEFIDIDTSFMPASHISNDNMFMYAFTSSKEFANEFKKYRSDLFIMRKHDITKEQYEHMKRLYGDYNLNLYKLYGYNKTDCYVISNSFELDKVEEIADDIDYTLGDFCSHSYELFNNDYQIALDNILYTYHHDYLYGDDSVTEMTDYNMGRFNLTPLGRYGISFYENTFEVFIENLKSLFK